MNTVLAGVSISPVNMDDRRAVGIKAGDTVRVHQKIQDKGKTRIQVFEGLVLARKHGNEPGATFTVRKVVDGVGVEKIFPLYSPMIDKIEITRRSKVRRAKLYYIREKVAREIKRQMRRMQMMQLTTQSETEAEAQAEKAEAEAEASASEEETNVAEPKVEERTEGTVEESKEEDGSEEQTPEREEEKVEEKAGEKTEERSEEDKKE